MGPITCTLTSVALPMAVDPVELMIAHRKVSQCCCLPTGLGGEHAPAVTSTNRAVARFASGFPVGALGILLAFRQWAIVNDRIAQPFRFGKGGER